MELWQSRRKIRFEDEKTPAKRKSGGRRRSDARQPASGGSSNPVGPAASSTRDQWSEPERHRPDELGGALAGLQQMLSARSETRPESR